MDPGLLDFLTQLIAFGAVMSLLTVCLSSVELCCYRDRPTGRAANSRMKFTHVLKTLLASGATAMVASLSLGSESWEKIGLRDYPSYAPTILMFGLTIAAFISYRLEVASEQPDSVYDLYMDLREKWREEEVLSKSSLARHRAWLNGFIQTNGGRSINLSRRPLEPRLQNEIDVSLDNNYRDVKFVRMARCLTPRVILAIAVANPWRTAWRSLPLIVALMFTGLLITHHAATGEPASHRLAISSTVALGAGLILSIFNIWARWTSRLRTYCLLKRREQLCVLLLAKLQSLRQRAVTEPTPHPINPPGILRRLVKALW